MQRVAVSGCGLGYFPANERVRQLNLSKLESLSPVVSLGVYSLFFFSFLREREREVRLDWCWRHLVRAGVWFFAAFRWRTRGLKYEAVLC